MSQNNIIHIDMDAFFASVEELDFPQLKGKPVVVGGKSEQRSVVAAASYEARKFGIYSAMPMVKAKRLCAGLVIRPVRMQRYSQISREIHKIFNQYTPIIEPISLDEAFLDVEDSLALFGSSEQIARKIKQQIRDSLDLIASVGIAPNKFLAKLASDLDKPDGFVIINQEDAQAILEPLSISKIWGVGKTLEQKLNKLGIHTISQLRRYPLEALTNVLGNNAHTLLKLASGIDHRKVGQAHKTKSISVENTFAKDIETLEDGLTELISQVEDVAYKLRCAKLKAKTVTVKIRYNDFRTLTRSKSLELYSDSTQFLWETAEELYISWHKKDSGPLRLIGFGVNAVGAQKEQQLLFGKQERQKQESIDKSLDLIAAKYGQSALQRATSLKRRK